MRRSPSIVPRAASRDTYLVLNDFGPRLARDKYADLRQHYFGPPSPTSATVAVPQLADPDFLVQVEAFAKIQ